jgi:hypothetical protein
MFIFTYLFYQDPKVYVETILDIHTKFYKLVQESFSSEQGFTAALDKVNSIDFFLISFIVPVCFRLVGNSLIIMQLQQQLVIQQNHLNY